MAQKINYQFIVRTDCIILNARFDKDHSIRVTITSQERPADVQQMKDEAWEALQILKGE